MRHFFVHHQKLPARHVHSSGLKFLYLFSHFSYILLEVGFSISIFAEGQGQNTDARCGFVVFNNLKNIQVLSKDAV